MVLSKTEQFFTLSSKEEKDFLHTDFIFLTSKDAKRFTLPLTLKDV